MLQLMHQLGDTRLPINLTTTGATHGDGDKHGSSCATTVGGFASRNASHTVALLYNQAERGAPISTCAVELTVTSVPAAGANSAMSGVMRAASVWRIDEKHANPKAMWESIGMPQWPSDEQNKQIFQNRMSRRRVLT